MNKPDMATVHDRLNGLAELYGAKPPTTKAVEFWWDALRGFASGDVLSAIDIWMRSRSKMPMPSDIVVLAGEAVSDRIERQAIADKAQEKREIEQMVKTPYGRKVLDEIRALLAKPKQLPPRVRAPREPGQDDEEVSA